MNNNLAIYIHWPFCKAKCPYCDFNSHVHDTIDHNAWAQAYIIELNHVANKTTDLIVTSVFFGGGTPSLMEPRTVQVILDHITDKWTVSPKVEITLEANPTSIEADKFKAFKTAGINRVSVGVQSLRNDDLKFLGREHSADEAIQAIKTARDVFDRYSFDLIYARPQQTIPSWENELKEALNYAGGHLSLYQLTIEPATPFYTQHKRGQFRIPEQDQAGEFYEVTQSIMNDHNLPAYEVSNHAHAGQESIHNLTYWQYGDYAGIGPGAHGRLTLDDKKYGTRTHRAPDIWLEKVNKTGHGYHPFETISSEEQQIEKVMMGLRLKGGIKLTELDFLPKEKLDSMITEGFLERHNDCLCPTFDGLQRLNSVLSYLLT